MKTISGFPRHLPRMRKVWPLLMLAVLLAAAATAYWNDAARHFLLETAARWGWYDETSHELVAVRDEAGNFVRWTCSMHPWVNANEAGKCPICGMDLVAVAEPRGAAAAAANHAGHAAHRMPAAVPAAGGAAGAAQDASAPASNRFSISQERQQLIGVRFAEVVRRPLTKTIRTVGRVELDERGIARIHSKVSGWIEQTFVDFTWQHVAQGDPLFTIYSPELVAAQEEYLLALRAREQLGQPSNPFPKAAQNAGALLESARARLQLWDVSPEQIAELERTRTVQRTLTVYSPISGHVMERNAYPRVRVTPETTLYTIADHSHVWVYVDIYENEIRLVRLNQNVAMSSTAYPSETFRGTVAYIDPHVQPETRTLRVRLEFPNPDLRLKPGMYADVRLEIPLGLRLAVPKDAVLRTGEQDLVFVDRGGGQMEVRQVRLGTEVEDAYEILAGLRSGERVVAAANFLVDAESQVQGAVASWQAPPQTAPAIPQQPSASSGGVTAEIVEPQPARVGTNLVHVRVRDGSGNPVAGAEVELSLFMPAMGSMPPMTVAAVLRDAGGGQYSGTIDIPMGFSWQTTITVRKDGRTLGTVRGSWLAR